MIDTSTLELSKSAFENNLTFLKDILGDGCMFSSVVKGNAYGHGIEAFVRMAEKVGVRHFSVFSSVEAARVKRALKSSNCKILIMGMIHDSDLKWIIQNKIEFQVFSFHRFNTAIKIAKSLGIKALIHIELDTGLNRTGFKKEDLPMVNDILKKNANDLIFKGLSTHFAGAESIVNHTRIQKQIKKFNAWSKWFIADGCVPLQRHTACSAAAMAFPETRMDMARIGIMQYGFWPSKEILINYLTKKRIQKDPLMRVLTWKTRVMSTQKIKTGDFVGYGNSYMAESNMVIAAVPVGYSQGYSRSLSNQGRLLIKGHRVSVIGLVNMNMLLADVSHVPDVRRGDEVVLIGRQNDLEISVSSFSEMSAQLNYEMLTRLPSDLPRKTTS